MYHSYLFLHYVPCWEWHPPFTHEILLYFTNRSDGRQVKQPWRRVQMNREERSRHRRSVQHRYHIITKEKLVEFNCLSFAPQLYLRLRGQLNKKLTSDVWCFNRVWPALTSEAEFYSTRPWTKRSDQFAFISKAFLNSSFSNVTVEPWYNEPLHNEVLGITNDCLYSSNSKIYGKEPRYSKQKFPVPWPFI